MAAILSQCDLNSWVEFEFQNGKSPSQIRPYVWAAPLGLIFGRVACTLFMVHRIAFQFGSFTVTWYGVLVASGFMAGLWTASRRALRDHIHPETIFDLGPWLLLGVIAGARTLYVVSYWKEDFAGLPITEIFMVQHGGLVFYGGLIGASLACVLFAWRKRLPLWRLADVLAPSIALGSFFGRWGCLTYGCCYGRPTSLPWGIQFPKGINNSWPNYVHPTEIYDSTLNLGLYLFLAWLYRRKKFDGQVFALYLICYAVFRSFVEVFRGDYTPVHYWGWLTPGQLAGIGIIAAGAILLWKLPRKKIEMREVVKATVADKA
jgi:phosphatidylglycerol:prolipoprotein diacylglycerol transferase